MYKLLDLFSGIGGFSLGLEATGGFETVAFCEFDKHARKVLNKHWPKIPIHEDVRCLDGKQYRGTIDVVCGGFPCQDVSVAGKKKGIVEGERSNLYVEMLRVVSECGPRYAIFENVTGLLAGESGRWFAKFLYDLAEVGYDAQWHCISASYVGAPHHRDRIWIVAYPKHDGQASTEKRQSLRKRNDDSKKRKKPASELERLSLQGVFTDSDMQRRERCVEISNRIKQQIWKLGCSITQRRERFNLSQPGLCGGNDGVTGRSHRLKQLGNSVVPLIPQLIGQAILDYEASK